MKDHYGKSIKAEATTARAYRIVNQLQAPDLMGECEEPDRSKAIACNFVLQHWAGRGEGAMMPADLRAILEYWDSRFDELVTNASTG